MPTAWDQLTRGQLLYVCRLFRLKLSEFDFKLSIFIRFTGIRALPIRKVAGQVYYAFKKKGQIFWISIGELHFFIASAGFLAADSQLTKNLFPVFRLLHRRFFGPANKCYNITLLELLHIEAAIHRFHTTRETVHLRTLCAILYRPQQKHYDPTAAGYNGDRREPFNDFTYQRRARWFKLLHPNRQYAVYVFYIGCRNALVKAHPSMFKAGATVTSEPVNMVDNIKSLMFDLNNGDVTKTRQIEQTPAWDAFFQLNKMVEENEKAKRLMKKR
jgi:hypothetical protein